MPSAQTDSYLRDIGAGNPLLDLIHTYFIFNMMGAGIGTHGPDEMSFIGLTYGELERFWVHFLPAYCGDEDRAERLNVLLEPWGWFLYLMSSMAHPRLPQKYRVAYADRMRSAVLSRAREMREGLTELCTLCGLDA